MYRKLVLGIFMACITAFGLNHIPSANADTLAGCPFDSICSDDFYRGGVPI